jgi:arylsulfatase A-like enzyme
MKPPRPHIILLLSDEHRGQAMSHADDRNVRTPHMDQLSAEGAGFARAYSNCPVCTPSRGTIFSGRHAHSGPVAGFFDHYKAAFPSIATELRAAGYRTAYMGKWHCGVVPDQLPPGVRANPEEFQGGVRTRTPDYYRAGFQDWLGFENLNQHFTGTVYRDDAVEPERLEGFETDALTDHAIAYLEAYKRDEPLFLTVSVTPPHFPMAVPEKWRRLDPDTLDVPGNFMKWKGQPTGTAYNGAGEGADEAEVRHHLADYYAMIENLDANLGRLRAAIAGNPRFTGGNTIFIYVSDHGDFMGSHGYYFEKKHPHEESVRIPALFARPGHIAADAPLPGLFGLVDLAPTLLGLAGLASPEWMQGADWSPVLTGQAVAPPVDHQLLEMVGVPGWCLDHHEWRGLVTERWKYAFFETGQEILFDLENDPDELDNLAVRSPELLPSWRERLLAALAAAREPSFDVIMRHAVPHDGTLINVSRNNYRVFPWPDDKLRQMGG